MNEPTVTRGFGRQLLGLPVLLAVPLVVLPAGCRAPREPSTTVQWVRVPAGTFEMGSPPDEEGRDSDEGPLRQVAVAAFEIGRTEVTNAQYRGCVEAGACTAPQGEWQCTWKAPDASGLPVACVTVEQSRAFCAWAGGRLPTEAEWEYAARAGSRAPRHGELDAVAWWRGNTQGRPGPAGAMRPNAWGLHDMLGNVWERVEDCWHPTYEGAPVDGTAWTTDCYTKRPAKVGRGGAWDSPPRMVRVASRHAFVGDQRGTVGFRCVRSAR